MYDVKVSGAEIKVALVLGWEACRRNKTARRAFGPRRERRFLELERRTKEHMEMSYAREYRELYTSVQWALWVLSVLGLGLLRYQCLGCDVGSLEEALRVFLAFPAAPFALARDSICRGA